MSSSNSLPPRVFLSYSHDSRHYMDQVLLFADRLRTEGIDACLDQYEVAPPEGWPRWMQNQIEKANFVLVLCTPTYYRRFRGLSDSDTQAARAASWEGAIITQELFDVALANTRFIPVIFTADAADFIPLPLRGMTFYNLSDPDDYENLC